MYEFDYSELRGRIIAKFHSLQNFGEYLGKSSSYVSRYINGHSEFGQETMALWIEALDIVDTEVGKMFCNFKRKDE